MGDHCHLGRYHIGWTAWTEGIIGLYLVMERVVVINECDCGGITVLFNHPYTLDSSYRSMLLSTLWFYKVSLSSASPLFSVFKFSCHM